MITLEQLEQMAPAAFSDSPAPHVSDRYKHVKTADIVSKFMDAGFVIRDAHQQKTQSRTAEKAPFQKHRVSLRMPWESNQKLGEVFPTVDLINSGDWSSNLVVAAGLYRLICENGMIAPFNTAATTTIKVRHDRIDDEIGQQIEKCLDNAPRLFEFAEKASELNLHDHEVQRFGREAARIRWSLDETESPDDSMVQGLLKCHRYDDEGSRLWEVFQRVQENGTRGGFQVPDANNRLRRVRERRNIATDLLWNQGLWDLTQKTMDEIASMN